MAGTANWPDFINDGQQAATGSSPQYRQAINLAQTVARSGKVITGVNGQLSFTGHSLGGGLALAAATSFQHKEMRIATTFNAAGLTVTVASLPTHLYAGLAGKNTLIENHVIGPSNYPSPINVGDPLSFINGVIGGMYTPGRSVVHYGAGSPYNLRYNHSMDAFRGLLDGF